MITQPVEFLVDKCLEFINRNLSLQALKEVDLRSDVQICDDPKAMDCVRQWMEFQDGQQVLLQTPSILVGYRVQVYRSEGTTQWYTAVIKSYSDDGQMLNVTDDTVLEEHQINPTLVQVNLLGDGVINWILHGEESGIRASRTRRGCQIKGYSSTALQSPLKVNKRRSDAKGSNLSATNSENCKVYGSKRKSLNGSLLSLNSKKLLKQSNSASYISKHCDQNVSTKTRIKTPNKPLEFDKTGLKRDLTETVLSSDLSVECVRKCNRITSLNNNSPDNLLHNSCGNLDSFKQEELEIIHNTSKNKAGITKGCSGVLMQTGRCSLPGSNDVMPKLKGLPASSADYYNNSRETLEAKEHLKLLKSVVSVHHTMSLLPPKTIANLPSSSPMECLNLSGKTQEVRRQLLPVVKTNETGETNISGLNLNKSVTDQITQRSREKIARTASSNEAQSLSNSAIGCVPATTNEQRFQETDNLRRIRNAGCQDFAVILNNSLLQQRNFIVSNSLNCSSEADPNIAKNLVNSKPLSVSRVIESQSGPGSSETKAGSESLIPKLSATLEEASTRKNIGLNAGPYALPLFTQAPATTTVTNQLPTPSLVNQTFPLSHLLLQNQLALQMEQWRVFEKQLQLSTSSGSVGAILAAYPQYMPNAISPEVFWMHYQERLREAMVLQQQQQQQQQLTGRASDCENKTVPPPSGIDRAVKNVSSSMVVENLKKELLSTNSLPQKITDSRMRESSKESVIDRCKDTGVHNQLKRSELIVHGTAKVNESIDQHFTESLRLAGQKPSAVVLPSGSSHRNSFTHSGVAASSVCQDQDQLIRSRNNLIISQTEPYFMKESQKQRIDSSSASMIPMPLSSLSTSLHFPLTSVSATASVQAAGLLSSSVPSSLTTSSSSSASTASRTIVGSLAKIEPNFNLYGYQPCAIYLPQNAVEMQGFKDDKKAITNEQENRKKSMEKFTNKTGDGSRQSSSALPSFDDGRLKDAAEPKSFLLAGLGQCARSPQTLKADDINPSKTKTLVLPEKYLSPSSLGDEVRKDGSMNYVVAASGLKGHPVFIPVLPILSNGQTPIIKMPTLKDCLASKPQASKTALGSDAVAGSAACNSPALSAHSSVVGVPDRAPNGLLTSLPISSAAAVYSFSLSHSQGLHLLQNSISQSVGNALVSSSSSVVSSTSTLGNYPQNVSKREHRIMAEEMNGFPGNAHSSDVIKKQKTNSADLVPTSHAMTASGASAAVALVPNSLFAGTAVMCSPNSTKMPLTYSDCFRSFVETTNCVDKSCGVEDDQVFSIGSVAGDLERLTVIVSREGLEEDKYRALDLKLPSGESASKMQDSISELFCVDANRGADSDTLSAYSPAAPAAVPSSVSTVKPTRSDPVAQKQWQHTKFKKAMLQRYSDEDKKNGTNVSQDAEVKRTLDHETLIPEDKEDTGSCGGTNNDTTSVASEQDFYEWMSTTDSVNSSSTRKKRKSNRIAKSEPPDKALKLSSDTDESTTSSLSAVKLMRIKKAKRQNKKDDSESEMFICQKAVSAEESKEAMTSRGHFNCLLFLNSSPFQIADCQSKITKRQEELKHFKCRDDPSFILANKALNSNSEDYRQQTMEVFLQDGACRDVTPRLVKCRECKLARSKKDKRVPNDFCRFYAFRRLRYSPKRFLTTAGFSEPGDADALDIELWMPLTPVMAPSVDIDTAKYIITYVGNRFISLVEQEQEAISWCSADSKLAWKRAVQGVREMCDSCDATLFNVHWVCEKCGFAVCIDCFRMRSFKRGRERGREDCCDENCHLCEHHSRKWLTCSANRQTHEPNQLTMAQIIPSDVLWVVGNMLKQIQKHFFYDSKVKSEDVSSCEVPASDVLKEPGTKELPHAIKCGKNNRPSSFSDLDVLADSTKATETKEFPLSVKPDRSCRSLPTFSDLSLLAEAAAAHDAQQITNGGLSTEGCGSVSAGGKCSTLKDLLTKATSSCPSGVGDVLQRPPGSSMQSSLEEVIHKVMKLTSSVPVPKTISFSHYRPCNRPPVSGRPHPIPKCTLEQSHGLFPDVLHSWIDDGRVLRLLSPQNSGNVQLFQQQWQHNLPVVISNCNSFLDNSIWKPETFLKEFGNFEGQLVDCIAGDDIDGHRMKKFWDGFERIPSRLKDKEGRPMILKLKNWPLKDEFCELMPNHSQDLLHNLPLPEYTKNNGPFNLVSRLPEFFAKPDLGPKLCCAYGQAKHCQIGTTDLHTDVSDAFNLLVYVGIPKHDLDNQKSVTEALEGCGYCQLTKDRLKEPGTKPGAVWHVFDPEDADKIRDLLNKVASERGEMIELHHDPIHDQSWYLDHSLRERLNSEYGVQCCTIIQCLGDAIFVPAAAPHQVCNLNSCISITCDFVSPENLDNCFKMTQECHHLSGESRRVSHEDKLQIKNIIYHALKDAVAVLNETLPSHEG